jgi:hypothetical protein
MTACTRPHDWKLFAEGLLHASPKVSQALWQEVCKHHDVHTLMFSPARTGTRFRNPQSLLLLQVVSPVELLRYVEHLLAAGVLKRHDVVRFEENVLEHTTAEGCWK